MIKHIRASLGRQDWTAVAVELVIVVLGVFIGTQVSNWNADRLEQIDNRRMLGALRPEIANMVANFGSTYTYYDTGRRFADTALAGWRGDVAVSERAFVVAALQASQIYYTGLNNASWSQIYGSDRLRSIDDPALRQDLSLLMTTDYSAMEHELFTQYRQHVREIIPADVQEAIQGQCGDRTMPGTLNRLVLPPSCTLRYPEVRIAAAAAALRAHPELVGELNWHLAAIATYRQNFGTVDTTAKDLLRRLGER